MQRILRRRSPPQAAPEPEPQPDFPAPPSWQERLGAVGRAIDNARMDVREVAVITGGAEIFISALARSTGRFYSGWLPITFVVIGESLRRIGSEAEYTLMNAQTRWGEWLTAIGNALDLEPSPLRDVLVLRVPGGFIVEALIENPVTGAWEQVSREYTLPGEDEV